MKLAIFATVALGALTGAAAFAPGKVPAFARNSVAMNMSSADFVNTEIAAHDVSLFLF